MTREEHRTVVTNDPLAAGGPVASETHQVVEAKPSGGEVARRVIVLAFGIIQVLLILRIVLLLIGANQVQPLVEFILAVSAPFVVPFQGILGTDAVTATSGSVLDVAAVVALIGWSVLEVILLWATNIFRRETA